MQAVKPMALGILGKCEVLFLWSHTPSPVYWLLDWLIFQDMALVFHFGSEENQYFV